MSEKLQWALTYAQRGWYVLRLVPGGKAPFGGSHAVNDATLDEDQIRAWWTETPDANRRL